MSVWIKICGLRTAEAVEAAVLAGVDAIGFVFHPASPRHIAPALAARLAARVPASIERIAVTRHPTPALLDALFADFRPDALQTDASDLDGLIVPSGVRTLPVLRTGVALPMTLPRRCLYESAESGQGHRADWCEATEVARRTQVILAGGLDPVSVVDAIRQVRPFGVDVSSGVESAPGQKDSTKIRAFVAAARTAAAVQTD
jgi:phosphoribosylanthranilate isomerase